MSLEAVKEVRDGKSVHYMQQKSTWVFRFCILWNSDEQGGKLITQCRSPNLKKYIYAMYVLVKKSKIITKK